jgi:hypothetical protein
MVPFGTAQGNIMPKPGDSLLNAAETRQTYCYICGQRGDLI